MTLDELNGELDRRKALIVHFSHHAAMRDDLDFPTDMLQILSGMNDWVLSCSVLTPGHTMNVVGSLGVILRPQSADDVLRVHYSDAGAWSDETNNYSLGEPLSMEGLERSLTKVQPGDYNEWRVRGAKPTGIFVLDSASICVRQKITFTGLSGPETTQSAEPMDLECIRQIFRDWPIWTMTESGPVKI